jgi:hypothetical protein
MSYEIEKWLWKLQNRLIDLREEVQYRHLEHVEQELNVCQAMLTNIEDLACWQQVNMFIYHDVEREIRQDLAVIRHILARRREPWWRNALRTVAQALDRVGRIFHLDFDLTRRLSSGGAQYILPPGEMVVYPVEVSVYDDEFIEDYL